MALSVPLGLAGTREISTEQTAVHMALLLSAASLKARVARACHGQLSTRKQQVAGTGSWSWMASRRRAFDSFPMSSRHFPSPPCSCAWGIVNHAQRALRTPFLPPCESVPVSCCFQGTWLVNTAHEARQKKVHGFTYLRA